MKLLSWKRIIMALNNFFFIPFLFVVISIYWLSTVILKNSKHRKEILYIELIIASYGFIGCINIYYAVILFIVSLISYFSQTGIFQPYTWSMFGLILLVIVSFAHNKISQNNNNYCGIPIQNLTTIKGQTIFFVLCGLTIILAYVGNTAFIYGNF